MFFQKRKNNLFMLVSEKKLLHRNVFLPKHNKKTSFCILHSPSRIYPPIILAVIRAVMEVPKTPCRLRFCPVKNKLGNAVAGESTVDKAWE